MDSSGSTGSAPASPASTGGEGAGDKKKRAPRDPHKVDKLCVARARSIIDAEASLPLISKTVGFPAFKAAAAAHSTSLQAYVAALAAVHTARGNLKSARGVVQKFIKKSRSAVETFYGDDAEQLALVGIKPISQYKRGKRTK